MKPIFKTSIIAILIAGILSVPLVVEDEAVVAINPPQENVIVKEVVKEVEVVRFVELPAAEEEILRIHNEKQVKIDAINTYLKTKNASIDLEKLTPILVEMCYLYDIDPFRPMAIMIHETGFGKSNAFRNKNNVAGINWTSEQKRKIGIRSDVYNLAVEKTLEASVTNLVMLLVKYKNFKKPLVKLSEIQTKYAPTSDPRNGLDGVYNNEWTRDTIKHYYNMESIYNNIKTKN